VSTCVPWDLDSGCCDDWDTLDPALCERATTLAWSTLNVLTGGLVGSCPTVVRPCLSSPCATCRGWYDTLGTPYSPWVVAGIHAGDWVNRICGSPRCSCTQMCELVMPGLIAAIIEVNLDGVELPLSDFRVDNGHRIVRMDGECWPSCQEMSKPVGQPGTLGITYIPGIIPDAAALWAAGVLACEFAKACSGGKCRLPSSVTTIARQGVSMTIPGSMFEGGMTGIREVDAYVISVNPYGHRTPPMVWSPDAPWAKHRYETPQVEVVP
jgi:hypothetical protein